MKLASYLYTQEGLLHQTVEDGFEPGKANLVLCFGEKNLLLESKVLNELRASFNKAELAVCSTAGEIFGAGVYENSISVTVIQLEKSYIKTHLVNRSNFEDSYEAGVALVAGLSRQDLKYVLVLADGSLVNGSELVRGIHSTIEPNIPVTGGLAGDGTRFESTVSGLNEARGFGNLIAIGFYGEALQVGHGSLGGWDIFGRERCITKSQGNELFEIDGLNALELYKQYLGKYANDLPGSALLFPLSLRLNESTEPVVRTILQINAEKQSMIFAGDVPEGARVRFMKANFDNVVDAAGTAAQLALEHSPAKQPKLALLISCVGRKIILDGRTDEELEAVDEVYNHHTVLTGFYSYGEISPLLRGGSCQLQNQTMTITTLDEH